MIGYAHVSDIETLEEPARSSAAGAVVRTARRLLHERAAIDGPTDSGPSYGTSPRAHGGVPVTRRARVPMRCTRRVRPRSS